MKKLSKKVKILIAVILLIALIAGAVGTYFMKKMKPDLGGDMSFQVQSTEEGLSAEGTTTMGTIAQDANFDVSVTRMYIEEVYVAAGDTVEEGAALYKIADECIEEAKAYYEKQIVSAQDAYSEAQVAYESGKLDAYYLKLDTETAAANAQTTYDTALAELDENLNEKYEAWQKAIEEISAYEYNLTYNVYYENAGIGEKTVAAENAKNAYNSAKASYDAAGITYEAAKKDCDQKVTQLAQVASGTSQSGVTIEAAAQSVVDSYNVLANVELLYNTMHSKSQELEQANKDLEKAKESYQKEVEQAEKAISTQNEKLDSLKTAYDTANIEYETKKLELQNTYELAVLGGEYAEETYNKTVLALEDTLKSAEEKLNDLKEGQQNLLSLENGVITAQQAGILAAVNYGVEDILFSTDELVSYYDTSKLDISLEIPQENIANVEVGEEVSVSMDGKRTVTGTVASVASSATTEGSKSDVTYTVIVSVENADGSLSAGTSVTVLFEDGKEGEVTDEN